MTTSLLRSENGQLFLVTYNLANKIVSKHQINLQLNADEDFSELKTSSVVESPTVMNKQAPVMNNIENPYQPAATVNIQKDQAQTAQSGDALQLAMQEIGGADDYLEPVSHELKLAALNAMIASGGTAVGQTYDCAICSKIFTRKYELKAHLSRHFGLNLFLCPVCGRQFSHSSNLIRHSRIHSGVKPYKCKDCGKRFNQANSLHSHREYLHNINSVRHTCQSCGRMYKTLQLLKRHCKINHQDENVDFNQPTLSSLIAKRRFHCSDCGESFTLKSQLRSHADSEHPPTQEQLEVNGVVPEKDVAVNSELQLNLDEMDSIDSMLREIQDENNKKSPQEHLAVQNPLDTINQTIQYVIDKVNSFICLECDKQFPRYMSYKQHWGVHETSLRKFECEDCGTSFAWKSTYMKHRSQFHSTLPQPVTHRCQELECNKEYKSITQLQEHVKRDHRMIRKFECDECKKQFYKAHDLLVHKRTHSKEKPYICGTCGKAFSHLSHVIRHEKSHNNIRPYTCPICKKSFTQSSVLKAHRNKKCPDPAADGGQQVDTAQILAVQ